MKKDENKDLIIRSAARVFERYGYKKATLDEIAQELNRGKSSLYYYFKNKEEVFEAVLLMETEQIVEAITLAVEQQKEVKLKLKTYIITRINELKKLTNLHNILYREHLINLPLVERAKEDSEKKEIQIIQNILQEGRDKGIFRISDVISGAKLMVLAMRGIEKELLNEEMNERLESVLDGLLNMLYSGILVKQTA